MFEQVTLKEANLSEKALHLAIQKAHSHKQGNNHSLDRSEVAGSGKKLFKQKGTGNARAGNKKTTQRRGGGKAFGPKFHNVSFKVNKKVKNLALSSSLTSKSIEKNLFVFEENALSEQSIKDLIAKNNKLQISFVLKDLINNSVYAKMKNYKNLNFHSDSSYSIHSALKSDLLIVSKQTSLFTKHMEGKI